jgi:hypothetical protein
MTYLKPILTAALAGMAIAAVTSAQAAAPAAAPAAPAAAAPAAAAPAAPKVLGAMPIVVDGYKYGGQLPIGADKNLEPLKMLIKAADAMGQLRDNSYGGALYLVLGDTTNAMRMNATGTWNGQKANVVLDWDYRVPGVRLDVQSPDGKTRVVTVAANNLAWDEKTPGVFGGKAATSVAERLVVPYLMPSAVILAGRDAADTGLKLSKDDRARPVLTIAVPKLGPNVNLVATLNTDGQPVRTQIVLNGKTYTGEFDDFLADRMDMAVIFPHKVVLKVDGKEFANVELNWHQANPYLIFPVPKEVAAN